MYALYLRKPRVKVLRAEAIKTRSKTINIYNPKEDLIVSAVRFKDDSNVTKMEICKSIIRLIKNSFYFITLYQELYAVYVLFRP